jgi:uncharacterized protein (TIGR02231 family)
MSKSQRIKIVVAMSLFASLPARAAESDLPPRVTRVVVYPDRALVTRTLELTCSDTPVAAVFRSLPYGLDPTTLKAAVLGGSAQVEGVSLYERVLAEAHTAQLRELDTQIEVVRAKINELHLARDRAQATHEKAESLRNTAGPFLSREAAVERKPNLAVWAQALDATREMMDEADARRRAADVALREQNRQLQELTNRRGSIASLAPRHVQDAEILVRCASAGTVKVELSYMTGAVSWQPFYEARLADSHNAIDLSVMANITQATGEAWKGVEVTLSTATTRRDATPPQIQPLHIAATPEEQLKKVLVRRDEEVTHLSSISTPTSASIAAPAVAAEDQGLSVQLKVPATADFAGDGHAVRVQVETLKLTATFKLLTIPKLLPYTFRSAEAVNTARYPLVPGRVDLFSGGGFIGSSVLPLVAKGDKVKLAFGIDEAVKVRRLVIEELKKDPGVFGSTRRLTYAYKVELSSFAPKATEVTLQDHVPVSQMDDVKVVIDPKTTAGYELSKDDGIVSWKLSLAPKEKRNIELRFALEVPAKYDSSGL